VPAYRFRVVFEGYTPPHKVPLGNRAWRIFGILRHVTYSGFALPADKQQPCENTVVDALSLFMPITRPAQLIVGLGVLLVVSFVLIHPSSSLSVPYSDFWQTLPTYTPPAVFDSDNRHLTSDQCHERYPGLFHEADLAKKFYQKKGGISLKDVDKADQDGGASARLAIINNKVSSRVTSRSDASSMSRLSMEVSILEHTLLSLLCTGRCWEIPSQ